MRVMRHYRQTTTALPSQVPLSTPMPNLQRSVDNTSLVSTVTAEPKPTMPSTVPMGIIDRQLGRTRLQRHDISDKEASKRALPLLYPPGEGSNQASTVDRRANDILLQTAAPATDAAVTVPTAPGIPPAVEQAAETGADSSQAPVDLEELVEKTWQKIMRKLVIEQERRGGGAWRFKS